MSESTIQLSIDPAIPTAPGLEEPASVARLTINRANKSNALDLVTLRAFVAAVDQAAADKRSVRWWLRGRENERLLEALI